MQEQFHQSAFPDQDKLAFNPNEYTEKELLKFVYRELHRLREDFDEYRKTNTWQTQFIEQDKKITSLEQELLLQTRLREESQKRNQRILGYVTGGFTILTLILKFVIH
jgi:hypothetical protein